jgi:hypothetical protein
VALPSGALSRFHASLPVRLRFFFHRRCRHRPIRPTRFRLETLVLPVATPYARISHHRPPSFIPSLSVFGCTLRSETPLIRRSEFPLQPSQSLLSLQRRLSLEVEEYVGSAYPRKHDRPTHRPQGRTGPTMRMPHLTTKERLAQVTWHRVYPRRSKSTMPHSLLTDVFPFVVFPRYT